MKIKLTKFKNPVIKNSLSRFKPFEWDSMWAYHPSVIEYKEKFYMFYTGKGLARGINHDIGLAVSNNLKTWKTPYTNPIIKRGKDKTWDSDFLAHAFVFKDDGKFYMLYDGSRMGDWLEEIGVAVSNNLIEWKKYEKNPIFKVGKNLWEKHHVSRCCIYKENGVCYLYYAGHDGTRERIGLARGNSIFTLKRFLDTPVLNVGEKGTWDEKSISDPRVFKVGRQYVMFYSGIDSRGAERTGLATSMDLIHWKKYDKNPVLSTSPKGWDSYSASRAYFLEQGKGEFYIFYSGRRKFLYSIGVAKLKISP